ncbi:unnamed protein product [Spodoptera littoralis]|uniref:Growth hormone-regulated TBC protein 1 n=2 Tax=Spodoptera TaxID=7106 RepID=A0A9P0N848_SPOLI|nr:growth hormone-regulated TBC protein 1-A [Spodoptera litura]CAB3513504.1 unnamed protein product [Spodoptera littoralis]CAH1643266.1 unnamed protein product [Spodoptera littoralis]
MAKSYFGAVDEYGFERHEDFDYGSYEAFMSNYLKVLASRAQKWAILLGDDGKSVKRTTTVKRYVRKGIPSEHRPSVWMAISQAEIMKEQSPDLYQKILDGPFEKELVDLVKTDLPRTFPDNIYFTKEANHQTHLFNILIAYAHNNRVVGYCQGLNYIAGLLLLATKNEETSFWLLKVLVEKILPDYYTKTMDGLIVDIEVLSELVKSKVPDVHQHVINLGLPWAVITTKWFVCLFAEVLPIETVLRIWDCLFYEGSKILFRVCLTLIRQNRQKIMSCNDFTSLAECFKSIVKDYSALQCHEFMEKIFTVPGSLSNSTIIKLRERFAKQRREQQQKEPPR